MKIPRTTLVAGLVSLVGACTLPGQSPPEPPVRACTEIGCESLLTVEFEEADIQPEETYRVSMCVDDECIDETVTIDMPSDTGEGVMGWAELDRGRITLRADENTMEYTLPGDEYGASAVVDLTLTDSSGVVVAAVEDDEVSLDRAQPNGPGCPPVCFTGRMTI